MKTCPECGIALKDEYQFCPEDGAPLAEWPSEVQAEAGAPPRPQPASAVVLYCPACAAEYPLTFSECPVHHTTLTTHGIPALVEAPEAQNRAAADALAEDAPAEKPSAARRLHLVSAEPPLRRSGLEAYEETLESLARPGAPAETRADEALPPPASIIDEDEPQKYRLAAIVVSVALGLLALIGLYAVISNASRKPAPSSTKAASAKNNSPQPTITVQTPQAAADYQQEATAGPAPAAARQESPTARSEADVETQAKPRRGADRPDAAPQPAADTRTLSELREQAAAQARHPQPLASAVPAAMRQPAATELVLPRGTFGLVNARLTSVRASRTASGYRYDLSFHLSDQAGHATQWERLAIVTHAASGATRQQQIPFFHRLGADGTLSFTVSVEMPGRAPGDWQGRIICTSIGSDSSGKTYRASFGANVSPN